MNTQNTLTQLLAELKTNRLVICPSGDDHTFGRIGRFTLSTDPEGDYLFAGEGEAVAEALHVRDFSLYSYNLAHQSGRAAVREYVRRKLKAPADAMEPAKQGPEPPEA
jgi:hypothetical protein